MNTFDQHQPWYQCLASLIVCGTPILGYSYAAQARSLAEIQKTQELRACIAFVNPLQGKAEPEGCRDNCKMSGDTADLVQAFASSLGNAVKVKGISVEWEEQFTSKDGKVVLEDSYTPALLALETCDFYATVFAKNAWRARKMDLVMMNPSRSEVVVRTERKGEFRSLTDLMGKTTATFKNSIYHTWLLEQNESAFKAKPVQIEFVADEEAALKAVGDAKVDFTILIADSVIPMVRRQSGQYAVAFPVGPVLEMGWAFRKEDKDLQAAAEKFFQTQRTQKDSLLNKQFKNLYDMSVNEFSEMVSGIK